MNVDVVQNEVTKIIVIEERLETINTSNLSPSANKELIISVAFGVIGGILLFLVLLCLCKRRRRRQRLRKGGVTSSSSTLTTTTSPIYNIHSEVRTTEDVTRRYERSVSALSTKSQIYLVPFAALPPDFDFSSREVEVKADYVILKDLKLLERYNSSNGSDGGVVNEAYQPQEPYNLSVYGTIPPLIREPYKKQDAYNPTFY